MGITTKKTLDATAKMMMNPPKQPVDVGELTLFVGPCALALPIVLEFEGVEALDQVIAMIAQKGEAIADQQMQKALSSVANELKMALDAALMAPVWAWTDGSRDIYDTGALAASGNVVINSNGLSVLYSAPYANLVHDGGYIHPYGNKKIEPVYLPPRPWIRSVLYGGGPVPKFDFLGAFAKVLG